MSASPQWRWPLLLGALTIAGLVAALVGEGGLWRPASWVALGIPLAVAAWFVWRPRQQLRRTVRRLRRTRRATRFDARQEQPGALGG